MDNTVNVLSLCSGYGGVELGLERLGIPVRPVAYVEREGFAIANLVAKMEEGRLASAPVFTDVKTFPYERFCGCVDLLTAGYPCQPFSAAGNRKGTDDPRHLWPHIARGIQLCKPGWVFLENVEGHITLGLSTVISDLEEMGYRTTWGIFSAAEVGAPHQRKRVFILADSDQQGLERRLPGNINYSKGRKEPRVRRTPECRLGDMANTYKRGGIEDQQPTQLWPNRIKQSSGNRWPSRPGEAQQEWEEPRVVANAGSKEPNRLPQPERRLEDSRARVAGDGELGDSPCQLPHGSRVRTKQRRWQESSDASQRQTEPELGRATDGARSRVDRLRLLGNGVVPATAAKAFATLYQELTQ